MSFFNDRVGKADTRDFHLFETTHPYMIELGLGSFTTGTLLEWWDQKNGQGVFINRLSINPRPSGGSSPEEVSLIDPSGGLGSLLGLGREPNSEFFWYGWKPSETIDNDGTYKRWNLTNDDDSYSYGLETQDPDVVRPSDPWLYNSAVGEVDLSNTDLNSDFIKYQYNSFEGEGPGGIINGFTLDDEGNGVLVTKNLFPISGVTNMEAELGKIFNIIQLNRYMVAFEDLYPRALWDKDDPDTTNNLDYNTLIANHEFILDIHSSKSGPYIQWSGEVTFYVNENDGLINCPVTEWIPFKLYLFDNANIATDTVGVAQTNTAFVGPRIDNATGKRYGLSEDGTWSQGDPDESESQVAGDLDIGYNSVTKKWESGTKNLIAKVVQPVQKSKPHPLMDILEQEDTQDALNDDSADGASRRFIPGSGSVMPIRVQNGNKLQWAPNYAQSEEARCETESKDKEILTAINFSRKRTFERGEEVLISQVDGVWVVSELAVGEDEEEEIFVTPGIKHWGEFTYFLTNNDFFFNGFDNQGALQRHTPELLELDYHKRYYGLTNTSPYNQGVHSEDYKNNYDTTYAIGEAGYIPTQSFKTSGRDFRYVDDGFMQVTSFDFMDSQMCGLRGSTNMDGWRAQEDKCAITSTRSDRNCAGVTIPRFDGNDKAASVTHGFFGAVFVNGYNGVSESYPLNANREFQIAAFSSGTPENFSPFYYMLPNLDESKDKNPFGAANGQDARNANRIETQGTFDQQTGAEGTTFTIEDAQRYRESPFYGPNPFYEYLVNDDNFFRSMPADIMTNSYPSESGFNEALYSLHRFRGFHTDSEDYILNAGKARYYSAWLNKLALEGNNELGNQASAYGFKPTSNRLMFRPCKIETFVQFNDRSKGETTCSFLPQIRLPKSVATVRSIWQAEINRTTFNYTRPAYYGVEPREDILSNSFGDERRRSLNKEIFYEPTYGIKWGGDLSLKTAEGSRHVSYWDQQIGGMQWAPADWGNVNAGGYGVITTYAKVAANEKITFFTNNLYGMGYWRDYTDFLIGAGSPQKRSWGTSINTDSYKQPGILLDLSARIYHHHPKSQTLYDPRTFAVHHFNADPQYAFDKYFAPDGTVRNMIPVRYNEKKPKKFSGKNSSNNPIVWYYNIPVPSSSADYQIPSRYVHHTDGTYGAGTTHNDDPDGDNPLNSIPITAGSFVFKDATLDVGAATFSPEIMESRFWQIDTRRVGKLLPYRYKKYEFGCGFAEGYTLSAGDFVDNQDFDKTPASSLAGKIIYSGKDEDYESGFAVDDVIGNEQLGVQFRVLSVDPTEGSIETVQCIAAGTGLSKNDFAASGDIFNKGDEGSLDLEIIFSVNGGNLNWSIAVGNVYGQEKVDPKPILLNYQGLTTFRVCNETTAPPNLGRTLDDAAENQAMITDDREFEMVIDPLYYSADKNYDVFLHFHNDITSTWMSSGPRQFNYPWGDVGNDTEAHEQSITLNIEPQ